MIHQHYRIQFKKENLYFWTISSLATLFVTLAIIGGIRLHSPVPFWDMWDGYIHFFQHTQEGDWSSWWAQHNEHRILLSRILFWIDISFFKGLSIFLIFFNFVLGGLISYLFYCILKKALPNEDQQLLRDSLFFFILAVTFSWMQNENYSGPFQSQFFLAYLLPLSGFYCLYLSTENNNNSRFLFLLASLTGMVSAGTMANGVLALPLMTMMCIFLKLGWKKIAFVGVLSFLIFYLYFHNYNVCVHHSSIIDSLLHHSLGFFKYYLLFFGNPFFYFAIGGKLAGILSGFIFFCVFLFFAFKFFKNKNSSSLQLVFFTFILYIGATTIGITGGRLGITHPMDSRYTTPAIMAWVALLILSILNNQQSSKKRIILPLIVILIGLLPCQMKALISKLNLFDREVAVLAIKMQIKDQKQISCVYPHVVVLNNAKKAIDHNLSIFGTPLFRNIGHSIGQIEMTYSSPCLGSIEETTPIEEENYVRIHGWIFDANTQKVPSAVRLLDKDHKIIGYALTGKKRKDVKKHFGHQALNAGFTGYMLAEYANRDVILEGI